MLKLICDRALGAILAAFAVLFRSRLDRLFWIMLSDGVATLVRCS
jgi:hypothetical protein